MNKFSYAYAALAVALVSTSIALAAPNPGMEKGQKEPDTYKIHGLYGSGQHGTVTLYPLSGKTRVTIHLTGEPVGAIEPAHVHTGNCAHPGPVIYPLTDVVAGHSTTLVNAPISKVAVAGNSVNVHKSAAQLNLYMACANLGSAGSM